MLDQSKKSYNILFSYIKDYISTENELRKIYYFYKKRYYSLGDNIKILKASSRLWRNDKRVDYNLRRLIKISEQINNNFLDYKLCDILQLFYFLIGLHEEMFYHKEQSHEPQNLIWKGRGYSFYTTASYVVNRYKEFLKGNKVQPNRERIEMSLCYLLIFLSRMFFSPYLKHKINAKKGILDDRISKIVKLDHKINIEDFNKTKFEFCSRVREVFKDKKPMQGVSKDEWLYLTTNGLKMLKYILNISYLLKKEMYEEPFMVLRKSMFVKDEGHHTVRTFMCRLFEGPYFEKENFYLY